MENGKFYNQDAREIFLDKYSVNLFISHIPYHMSDIEDNGGDPAKQLQNVESLEEYHNRIVEVTNHMEYGLAMNGHIFLALPNTPAGLGVLSKIENAGKLRLQSIRIWDYSVDWDKIRNHTVIFAHFMRGWWQPNGPQGPFVLTNSWHDANDEIKEFQGSGYPLAGVAPKGVYYELIRNYSRPEDTVCDLFGGAGTVQVVAHELGRKFVYNDIVPERVEMAKKRIENTEFGLKSFALGIPRSDVKPPHIKS